MPVDVIELDLLPLRRLVPRALLAREHTLTDTGVALEVHCGSGTAAQHVRVVAARLVERGWRIGVPRTSRHPETGEVGNAVGPLRCRLRLRFLDCSRCHAAATASKLRSHACGGERDGRNQGTDAADQKPLLHDANAPRNKECHLPAAFCTLSGTGMRTYGL